jgi:hypothetical protein
MRNLARVVIDGARDTIAARACASPACAVRR